VFNEEVFLHLSRESCSDATGKTETTITDVTNEHFYHPTEARKRKIHPRELT